MGSITSEWQHISKGVPQGSILGPLLFNIFLNDIFYTVKDSKLYNYADDNTLSFFHCDIDVLKRVLQNESLLLIKWFEENMMKANPDKFQAICIGKKTHESISHFKLQDFEIECEDDVTLLGVDIDYMLNFSNHVSELCKKASRQLAVLKRFGKFLTKTGKVMVFNSFILSNFNYCPIAWHFCNQASTNKMERIQERALRFINDDFSSSVQELLTLNNRSFLHVERLKTMASEVFKILHKQSPEYLHDLINFRDSSFNFRKQNLAVQPRVKGTRYGLRSFRHEAVKLWNSLPNNIRTADSYPHFRRLLHSWDGNLCGCTLCST